MNREVRPNPYWECCGCGATFAYDGVEIVFQCSLTHREPYRGSGNYIDCPVCGKFESLRSLVPPPPPDPNYKGPRLREVKPAQLIDTETVKPAPITNLLFFKNYGKGRK
jgi:hypothetical protein